MGTIIKFVINMEGLDADLDQIQNRLAFTPHKRLAKINPRIVARPLDELIRPLWAESKGFQYIPRKDPAWAIR